MQTLTSDGKDFSQTLNLWIKELGQYNMSQLLAKPSPAHWSLGQLYIHLIQATNFFIRQIHACTSNNDYINEEAFVQAKIMFQKNDFPDVLLEGPPSNASTPQPESKEQLTSGLTQLKNEMNKAEALILNSQFKGKTKHFGLGYFTASEWMQFSEMHFRHHLRQKKRLDDYIKNLQ